MSNLIRSEWFKLMRNRTFWLLLAVLSAFAVMLGLADYFDDRNSAEALHLQGVDQLASAMGFNMYAIKIGLGIFAGFFISSEYSTGTMKRSVSSGHNRGRIILAKMAVFIAGSVLVALAYPVVSLLLGSLLTGVGSLPDLSAAEYIVRSLGLTITLSAAFAAITALIAVCFNDSGKTIGFSIVLFFVIDAAFEMIGRRVPFVKTFYEYTVLSEIMHYAEPTLTSREVLTSVLISAATVAVFLLLGIRAFRRKEIK